MYGKNTKDKLSCKTLHSFLYRRKKSAQHQRGGTVQSIMLMFWLMSLFYFSQRKEVARMERVEHTENTIEVFENDIDLYLHQFQDEQNIDDLRTAPQSVWNGALMYVNRHVFKPNPQALKSNNKYNTEIYNNNTNIATNYNMYNYELVNKVLDYYIYLCQINNKEISVIGFENLTGITQETIYTWGENNNKLSSSCSEIHKKLVKMREESLSNKLVDGKQNPVGTIAVLNRQFGWASPYVSDSNRQKSSLTAAELPKLGANNPQKALPINESVRENGEK